MNTATEHRTWSELGAVTQAALRCKEPAFWVFLREEHGFNIQDEESAAKILRSILEVESRRELAEVGNAQAIWHDLDNLYQAWRARDR